VLKTRLHRLGVVVGDLSPKNLLFSLKPAPSCFLIDCDAMLVRAGRCCRKCRRPTGHPASPSAGTPAFAGQTSSSGQAAQLNNLLDSSTASRKSLIAAVQDVDDCTNVTGAISAISAVAGQRASEYTKAAALSTGDLRNGSALKSDLITALRYSVSGRPGLSFLGPGGACRELRQLSVSD
jgi:hypothetical protein